MRLAYLLISMVLIAAVVAPFYIKGPSGAPLMTVDDIVDDNTPEILKNTEAYRWQDEYGNWHFSDDPSENSAAQQFEIKSNLTPFKASWVAQEAARNSDNPASGTELSISDAYSGQAMEKAKQAAAMLEQRGEALDALMQQGRPK